MKNKKSIAIGAILATACGSALADDAGFYIGADVGRSSLSTSGTLTKSTDNVLGVTAGYQFNRNFGLEAQYTGLGRYSGIGRTTRTNYSGKTDAFSIAAVGSLPLSDVFSIYAKLGMASASNKQSSVAAGNRTVSRTAATYGVGVQYAVNPAFGVRFGWDRFSANSLNSVNATIGQNINIWSLGAIYKF